MTELINVYEVVRVINSKPLFLREHYIRFVNYVRFLGVDNVCENDFCENIIKYIKENHIINGNLRIDSHLNENQLSCKIEINEIPHKYPSDNQYNQGVNAITYLHERPNPQKKIWDADTRKKVDAIIKEGDIYEVIYCNSLGNLTEGSRSNLFFIKGNSLFTPKSDQVLKGVTRYKIIQLAYILGIEVKEIDINCGRIHEFESSFISGTSPKILPLKTIDKNKFDVSNELLRNLMGEFDNQINKDIIAFKGCTGLY
ncbi:MAG: aminotransferase class IV [Marinilabiliales bacterium]|nr:MAG: aminotransferase class IV [Marinilabiliales bacterium]